MASGSLIRGVLSALVTVAAVALVAAGIFLWDRLSGGQQLTPRPPVSQVTSIQQAAPPVSCVRARPTWFDALSAHLAVAGDRFGAGQYALQDGELTYLAAPVRDDAGLLRSPGPVWVYGRAGYAWVNDAARRLSTGLPSARTAYGVDPAGAPASRISTCSATGGR